MVRISHRDVGKAAAGEPVVAEQAPADLSAGKNVRLEANAGNMTYAVGNVSVVSVDAERRITFVPFQLRNRSW